MWKSGIMQKHNDFYMTRHKKRRYNLPIRKLAGVFVSSLAGFLFLAALGAYWAVTPIDRTPGSSTKAADAGSGAAVLEQAVKIFFANSDKNTKTTDCSLVYPIYRDVPKTSEAVNEAVGRLFEGLSWDEANLGYFNTINYGTKLNSLTIRGGVAHVDFNKRIEYGVVDSCNAAEIRSQITSTLKQFPNVKDVVISVDGKTDGLLRP